MSWTEAQKLRRDRAGLAEKARAIVVRAREDDNRAMTPEEHTEFDTIHTECDQLLERITTMEAEARQADVDADLDASQGAAGRGDSGGTDGEGGDPTADAALVRSSFDAWVRFGPASLTARAQAALAGHVPEVPVTELRAAVQPYVAAGVLEERALSGVINAAGAFLIPEGAMQPLVEARAAFGGVRNTRAFILRTTDGREIPIPTDDDTATEGEMLAENTEVSEADVTIGEKRIKAYTFTSKMIRVPLQLLQDSATDVDAYIGRKAGRRLGKILSRLFTTGAGTTEPEGYAVASILGATAAATGAVTVGELYDLKHSVDPAYRLAAEWTFNDNTLLAIKKLEDSQNRPLWKAGLASGEPDRIDNDPFVIVLDMADMATTTKPIVYGDFSAFWIRDVASPAIVRFSERFMHKLQVGFLIWQRHDSLLIDAGTNPLKHLVMA